MKKRNNNTNKRRKPTRKKLKSRNIAKNLHFRTGHRRASLQAEAHRDLQIVLEQDMELTLPEIVQKPAGFKLNLGA